MESLSGNPLQLRQYWLTDYFSLFLLGIPIWKTIPLSCCLFQDGGGIGLVYNIICFLVLRLPDTPKNLRVFWKLLFQHLKTEIITCQEGRYEARRIIRFG